MYRPHSKENIAWAKKRLEKLIQLCGGKCVKCGSIDKLEFDHIDPATKKFSIAMKISLAWEKVLVEASKCQLLCDACHIDKHRARHGTRSRYQVYKCRCEPCREAQRIYRRVWEGKRKVIK